MLAGREEISHAPVGDTIYFFLFPNSCPVIPAPFRAFSSARRDFEGSADARVKGLRAYVPRDDERVVVGVYFSESTTTRSSPDCRRRVAVNRKTTSSSSSRRDAVILSATTRARHPSDVISRHQHTDRMRAGALNSRHRILFGKNKKTN